MECWDESHMATGENTDLTGTFNHNRVSSVLHLDTETPGSYPSFLEQVSNHPADLEG